MGLPALLPAALFTTTKLPPAPDGGCSAAPWSAGFRCLHRLNAGETQPGASFRLRPGKTVVLARCMLTWRRSLMHWHGKRRRKLLPRCPPGRAGLLGAVQTSGQAVTLLLELLLQVLLPGMPGGGGRRAAPGQRAACGGVGRSLARCRSCCVWCCCRPAGGASGR